MVLWLRIHYTMVVVSNLEKPFQLGPAGVRIDRLPTGALLAFLAPGVRVGRVGEEQRVLIRRGRHLVRRKPSIHSLASH